MTAESHILRPEELPTVDRGNGIHTTPLVTTGRGATTFLSGITAFEPAAAIDPHTHNCVESVTIIEGLAVVEIAGVESALAVHDTTVVPAGVAHRFRNASASSPMRILWIYGSTDATRTIVATGITVRVDDEQATTQR